MNRRDAIKALMVGLPATATVSSAKVEPDDVIVVECDDYISHETAERIKAHVQSVWPGRKAVVLGQGLHLKIAKAAEVVP